MSTQSSSHPPHKAQPRQRAAGERGARAMSDLHYLICSITLPGALLIIEWSPLMACIVSFALSTHLLLFAGRKV